MVKLQHREGKWRVLSKYQLLLHKRSNLFMKLQFFILMLLSQFLSLCSRAKS